jgi:hypothetical protein
MQYLQCSLITEAVLGSTILCDVKNISKNVFLADQNNHFAAVETYSEHKYGSLLSDAKRFDNPISVKQ